MFIVRCTYLLILLSRWNSLYTYTRLRIRMYVHYGGPKNENWFSPFYMV